MIHVETLEGTPRGLRDFLRLPTRLYRKDANWVEQLSRTQVRALLDATSPLNRGEHAFLVAYDDDRPVSRVLVGIDERLNAYLHEKRGYIWLFETAENIEYARAVLDAATDFLRQRGMTRVVGPTRPAAPGMNDMAVGLLLEGFDSAPMLFSPYNPPFYNEYFEAYGFAKHRDTYAYRLCLKDFPIARYRQLSDMAMKRFTFTVEDVSLRRGNPEQLADQIARVLRDADPSEWEQAPATREDILRELNALLYYETPELIVMAFAGDRPLGLFAILPEFSRAARARGDNPFPLGRLSLRWLRKRVNAARCGLMLVSPDYRNKAVGVAMAAYAFERATQMGIREIEAAAIEETSVQGIVSTERTGARRSRVYRQYSMSIADR